LVRWAIWCAVLSIIVFLPGGLNRWVFPKETLLISSCVLGSLVPAVGRLPRWVWGVVGAGGLLLGVSALQSAAPIVQVLGRWPRYEGIITLSVYVAALWLGGHILGGGASAARIGTLRMAVGVASITLGLVSMAEALGLHPIPTNAARSGALLGNASDQGTVGVMFFAVLVVPVIRRWMTAPLYPPVTARKKAAFTAPAGTPVLALAGSAAALITVVISASRAAAIALVLVVVVATALEFVRRRVLSAAGYRPGENLTTASASARRRRRAVVFGVVIASVGAVLLVYPLIVRRLLGLTPLAARTVSDRQLIYSGAVDVGLRHPLFGVGPSGFVDAIPSVLDERWYSSVGQDVTLDSPHNWVLQALVAGGIPLAVLAVAFAVAAAVVGVRRWLSSVRSGLDSDRADHLAGSSFAVLGFGVALLSGFTSPGTTILAALLLGSLLSVRPLGVQRVSAQFGRLIRTVVLAAAAVFLALASIAEIPLQAGQGNAALGQITSAAADFDAALALRPWDADTASIASQLMASQAEADVPGAAKATVEYARRSLAATPGSVQSAKAMAVGQQHSGDFVGARQTLAALARRIPLDGGVALRLGGVEVLLEDYPAAEKQLLLATRLSPKDASPWKTLAYLYGRTGDTSAQSRALSRIQLLGG
jgi:O-antigen ligase